MLKKGRKQRTGELGGGDDNLAVLDCSSRASWEDEEE